MDASGLIKVLKRNRPKSGVGLLSDPHTLSRVEEFVSTGCLPLDIIMGGGIPVGRSTEIYGDTSTGKSLLASHILAETQAMGGIAVLFDSETATSLEIMRAVGINPNTCVYSVPETIEEVYDNLIEVIKAKDEAAKDDLMTIVWDSVASTSSEAEVEKVLKEGLGGATMATHARLMSTMCRIIPRMIAKKRIALVFINQTRENIGVMYGDKMSTFGGRAVGYYASLRLEMAKAKTLTDDNDNPVGIDVRCYVAKSKVSPPFGMCRFPILFGVGIDKAGAVLEWIRDEKLCETGGSWSVIHLGNKDVKFQTRTWPNIYAANQEAIDRFVLQKAGYEAQ